MPIEERKSRAEEAGGVRAECSLPLMPRTRWGLGSVCPFDPHKYRSRAHGWRRPKIILRAGAGCESDLRIFSSQTRKSAVNL
jgi:hypothetical protein